MKEVFLSIVMVMVISLSASAMVYPGATGPGQRLDMILAQSMEQEITQGMEQEVPSDQGTPHEEMGSGEGTAQDTGSTQGICTGPADCSEQHDATPPDNN